MEISWGRSRQLVLVMAIVLLVATVAADDTATCYHPDGSAADSGYRSCNATVPTSMCCHLAYANNGGDACGSGSTYGLCGVTGTELWRESCTDPTWKDPACLQICTYGDGFTSDSRITRCFDGSYCCGENNATCCAEGLGYLIINNQAVLAQLSSTSSSSRSSSTPTSSTLSTNTIPATSARSTTSSPSTTSSSVSVPSTPSTLAPKENGLSTGAKAGIGIGAAALGLAVIAGVAFWLWKRKERENAPAAILMNDAKFQTAPIQGMNTIEADNGWRGYEADAYGQQYRERQPAELH